MAAPPDPPPPPSPSFSIPLPLPTPPVSSFPFDPGASSTAVLGTDGWTSIVRGRPSSRRVPSRSRSSRPRGPLLRPPLSGRIPTEPPPRFLPLRSVPIAPVAPSPSPVDWKTVCFGASKIADTPRKLSFFPPTTQGQTKIATLDPVELAIADKKWQDTLVGYVLGKKPFFQHLKASLTRQWKPKGSFEVMSRENGCFLFHFTRAEDKARALEDGPWFFDGRLVVLKSWTSKSALDRDVLRSIPVWIRLPELPLRAWTPGSIGAIASIVGTPLLMDPQTANFSRIDYARCLVELKAEDELNHSVTVQIEDTQFVQQVEFEWLPPRCSNCKTFGHVDLACPIAKDSGNDPALALLAAKNIPEITVGNRDDRELITSRAVSREISKEKDIVVTEVPEEGECQEIWRDFTEETCRRTEQNNGKTASETSYSSTEMGNSAKLISGLQSPVMSSKDASLDTPIQELHMRDKSPSTDTVLGIGTETTPNSVTEKGIQQPASSTAPSAPQTPNPDAVVEMGSSTLSNAQEFSKQLISDTTEPDSVLDGTEKMVAEKVNQIKVDTMLSPVQPFAVSAGDKTWFSQERVTTSLNPSEESSDDDGEVHLSVPIIRSKFNVFLSKNREERFQELRSFGSQLGQKLAKSAISQVSISDLPKDQEQRENDGAPFIEVKRKKSKLARSKGAGEQIIRASPRIVKPNPKYIR